MATINPGSGGTFACTTMEAMLFALVKFGINSERDATKNPTNINYISGTEDADTLILSVSLNVPCSISISSDGKFSISANDYLVNSGYIAATGGTLKSTNWVNNLIELIGLMINKEESSIYNPSNTRIFTGNYTIPVNTAGLGTFSVTMNIPLTETTDNLGNITQSAKVVFS